MTEAEWLASFDPQAMLFHLLGREPGGDQTAWGRMAVASDRKLRLFACAITRQMAREVPELVAIEDAADDPATNWDAWVGLKGDPDCGYWCPPGRYQPRRGRTAARRLATTRACAGLLRDIAGDPFRPVPVLGEVPYTTAEDMIRDARLYERWLTPQVLLLAEAAYQERPGRECHCLDGW